MHKLHRNLGLLISTTIWIGFAGTAMARDQVRMAGSSTILPYARMVTDQFGKTFTTFKAPLVQSGGTGAGLKQFCIGLGEATIDIANASRQILKDERARREQQAHAETLAGAVVLEDHRKTDLLGSIGEL